MAMVWLVGKEMCLIARRMTVIIMVGLEESCMAKEQK